MASSPTAPSRIAPSPLSPSLAAALALLSLPLVSACRRDFTEAVVPAAATSLALSTQQAGDTTYVDLVLGGGAPAALASVTGEVAHRGDFTFVQCAAQQPQALLACKAHGDTAHGETVRVAAAWAGGTHAGALVRLAFVRTGAAAAAASTPAPASPFSLAVTEAHGARGEALLGEIEVRRESVVAGVAR